MYFCLSMVFQWVLLDCIVPALDARPIVDIRNTDSIIHIERKQATGTTIPSITTNTEKLKTRKKNFKLAKGKHIFPFAIPF